MLNCKEITELSSDYLDGHLPRRQRLRIQLHLWMCKYCRTYFDHMRKVVAMLRQLPTETASPQVFDSLLPQFRKERDRPA